MTRKPADIVQPNLRIREDLRRRLEQAAKKRGVSLNYEMASRLKDSFDHDELFKLSSIVADMQIYWSRIGNAFHELNKQGDLTRAAEALVEQLRPLLTAGTIETPDRKAIAAAVAQVQKAINLINNEAVLLARRMHTTGSEQ